MKLGPLLLTAGVVAADQAAKAATLTLKLPYTKGELFHPLIAIAVVLIALWGTTRNPHWGLSLIIGGGISNLIDVAVRHYVVDILIIRSFTFNLADMAIALGFITFLWQMGIHAPASSDKIAP